MRLKLTFVVNLEEMRFQIASAVGSPAAGAADSPFKILSPHGIQKPINALFEVFTLQIQERDRRRQDPLVTTII
ncbi:hypothetical protein WK64_28270 [Burkholderia ubonensis]|nr:hypothetical protein WK64_28270 [Burkholderia ubonensis]